MYSSLLDENITSLQIKWSQDQKVNVEAQQFTGFSIFQVKQFHDDIDVFSK